MIAEVVSHQPTIRPVSAAVRKNAAPMPALVKKNLALLKNIILIHIKILIFIFSNFLRKLGFSGPGAGRAGRALRGAAPGVIVAPGGCGSAVEWPWTVTTLLLRRAPLRLGLRWPICCVPASRSGRGCRDARDVSHAVRQGVSPPGEVGGDDHTHIRPSPVPHYRGDPSVVRSRRRAQAARESGADRSGSHRPRATPVVRALANRHSPESNEPSKPTS